MEILPGGPGIEALLQDYRRRYALGEETVLNALMAALATRRAQALVAVEGGRPVGAVILSRQGGEGQIHLLHALADAPTAAPALLARAEEELARAGRLERISASLADLPGGPLQEIFRQRGYQVIPRARLVLDLAHLAAAAALPAGYCLTPWQGDRLVEAAGLVHDAHQSPEDIALYPDIAAVTGAQQFLERAIAGKWGRFDPACAPMLLAGDSLAGLCLAVWHAGLPGQGFILDLVVDAPHRQGGLGRALVLAAARGFRDAGAVALGLAVTWTNEPARRLYEGLGFRVEQYFGVFQKQG
jgi:ribosomal protein S18 acetylase RimI-like enzyme